MRNAYPREVEIYRFRNGREPFTGWLDAIRDQKTQRRIRTRLASLKCGISELAKQTQTKPQILSDALTRDDIPLIDRLGTVLKVLGYRLSIKPLEVESLTLETAAMGQDATPSRQAVK